LTLLDGIIKFLKFCWWFAYLLFILFWYC